MSESHHRCITIAVLRTDDRQILARYDVPDQSSLGIPSAISYDWNTISQRVAAAAVNRTRLQLELVVPTSDSLTTSSASGSNKSGSSAQIHAVVSRPKNIFVACVTSGQSTSTSTRSAAFVLCDSTLAEFEKMFVERTSTLSSAQCNTAFIPILSDSVAKFNAAMNQIGDGGRSKIDAIKQSVETTKQTVLENIDQAIDRGTKIDHIVAASADLSENAQGFSRATAELERTMWWKSMKIKIMVGVAILAIILILVLVVCKGKCFGRSGEAQ